MRAHEEPFSFISDLNFYEVPFFQRNYVWNDSNWDELLENLLNLSSSHFLGSLILKQKENSSGNSSGFSIIDGQQRLTTLSILLRACYDTFMLEKDKYSDDDVKDFEARMLSQLFVKKPRKEREVKIRHSHIDRKSYEKVITSNALTDQEFEEIKIPDDSNRSKLIMEDNILCCYKYFRVYLSKISQDNLLGLWELLTGEGCRFLVNIDLSANENEQAIFDTVNTAGVHLSCADTIKNALFQKIIEKTKDDNTSYEEAEKEAVSLHETHWVSVFCPSVEVFKYWNKDRQLGRLYRDNVEILLHCIAVIDGFFDPSKDRMADLSDKYKEKLATLDKAGLVSFLMKIKEYAELYKSYLFDYEYNTSYCYENYFLRLMHICDICEVSTFYPYQLKLLYDCKGDISVSNNELQAKCCSLEQYILLHAICKATTKNYNKECLLLINNEKVIADLLAMCDDITAETFDFGVKHISIKLATVILFWLELYRRNTEKADIKELKYTYTLEHVLPQKWMEFWKPDVVPVYNENNIKLDPDDERVNAVRDAAVSQIGNMTLLNSRLNTSLRNYPYDKKKNGEGKMQGMKDLADLLITKELINDNIDWDEQKIYQRTAKLTEKIKEIWNISL